jgi:hypothetical protein
LQELYQIKDQCKQELDSSISIGVGKELGHAQKALELATKSGGDKIELYTEDTDHALAELAVMQKSEPSFAEVLLKADEPALNKPAAGGGMTGPSEAAPSGPQAPVDEGSEHSQNEAYQSFMANQPPPAEPPDMMGEFSQLAQESEGQEQADKEQQAQQQQEQESAEGMKKELVQVLQEFQQMGPLWEELKQAQPEAYKVLEAMMQAMIKLARGVFGGEQQQQQQPVQKSEDLMPGGKGDNSPDSEFDLEQLATGIATEMEEHGLDRARAKEIAKDHLTEDPHYYRANFEKATHDWRNDHAVMEDAILEAGGTKEEARTQHAATTRLKSNVADPTWGVVPAERGKEPMFGWDDSKINQGKTADYRAWRDEREKAYWDQVESAHPQGALGVPEPDRSAMDRSPIFKRKKMEKTLHALEAGKTGRHQVVLPVGSQLDAGQHASRNVGKVKVRNTETGKTKWREVRAGQVMDPQGNPTSSLNPSGGVDKK